MTRNLFQAITDCRFKQVRLIVDTGLDLTTVRNKKRESALVIALRIDDDEKREKMFRYLARKGASCEGKDKSGRSVMAWTCILNRPVEMEIVMNETVGAVDFSERDKHGYTVLHYAVFSSNPRIVRYLVRFMNRYGLSVDVLDKNGLTPFVHAKRLAYNDIADILKDDGNASTLFGDAKCQRSVAEWEKIGDKERKHQALMDAQKKINEFKINGQLPKIPYIRKAMRSDSLGKTWPQINNVKTRTHNRLTSDQHTASFTRLPKTPNFRVLPRSRGRLPSKRVHFVGSPACSIDEIMSVFTDSHTQSYRIPVHLTAYSSFSEEEIRQRRAEHEAMLALKATKNRKGKKTISFNNKVKLPALSDEMQTTAESTTGDEAEAKEPEVVKPLTVDRNNLQVLPDISVPTEQ